MLQGVGAAPLNMHTPPCTSLPIPILLFLFPPPSPSSKRVRNEPELIESQKQLPGQVQWGRSSCWGSSVGGWLPREGGVEEGRLGSPCWLPGGSLLVARQCCSNRESVKAIRRPYHMKGWVGVAGPKMSPRRIAPLSNSRSLTKGPFTGPLLPPPLTHTFTKPPPCTPIPAGPIQRQPPWPQNRGIPPSSIGMTG